ncbi:MAG: tyrosine--tRNA ligase [Propionibacteriaceae bacterium]|nr:tyrosine--tRNA ligase [Propionibacteriaceae bacterium]
MNLFEDLTWRGLIAHSTDPEALAQHLDEGPVKFYVGFDPTASSLHIGHLMQLLMARRLQDAGHVPHLLVGGATGLIGDPKASGERVMNDAELVAGWVERIREQARRFVSFDGANAAVMVNNLDWTKDLSAIDFLRDLGKHFPVNKMLAREIVASRLESGISFTEFSYVLLQSNDFRELHRRYGVTLQTGGSDQWGNLTAGVELLRRSDQAKVHALATPLITKADGTKFGKTEGGAVWLDPELTSPYAFHQFFLNAEDAKVIEYLKVFTFRTPEEIAELEKATAEAPFKREAQKALADDVTDFVHGVEQRKAAVAAAQALFGRGELGELDDITLAGVMREVDAQTMAEPMPFADAMLLSGVVKSKSEARRAVSEGGAYLNNQKVADAEMLLDTSHLLHGRYAVIRRGRKTVGGVVLG